MMLNPAEVRSDLLELLKALSFTEEQTAVLIDAMDRIVKSEMFGEFSDLLEQYRESVDCPYSEMVAKMGTISDRAEIHRYTGSLLLFLCMAEFLKARYRERGIDESIFYNSMLDLRYKTEECMAADGIVGTFVAWWYPNFFNLTLFALGRLQFEPAPLGFEADCNGYHLTPDQLGLKVHVPKTGTPLNHDKVVEAYKMAREFFRDQFDGNPIPFTCHSWILSPWLHEVLPPTSNLLKFSNDFQIVETGFGKNYDGLWVLFGCRYHGDVDALPQDTTLRRAYADRVRRGEPTVWGHGVFVMD